MADENETVGKRDHGRQRAIDGILYSRFGERPCTAAEDALRALRSSAARPGTRRKRDTRNPRRKTNGRRRFAPPTLGAWPIWVKAGLPAAACLLLILTVRFVLQDGGPEPGGGEDQRLAVQPDPSVKKGPDVDAAVIPDEEKSSQPDQDQDFARQLAWTKAFESTGVPAGRGGLPAGGEPGAGVKPPNLGATGSPDVADGAVLGGDPRIGSPKPGGTKGRSRGGAPAKDGGGLDAVTEGGAGVEKGTDAFDLDAAVADCVRKLSFNLQIPRGLPGGYRLTKLNPKGTGDGVMLLYARGNTVARVFISPSDGPDTSFTKVKTGDRELLTARKRALLIAIEHEPAEADECEAWARQFVSP